MKLHAFLIAILVTLLLSQCAGPKEDSPEKVRTPMVICFDVEDYTSPASVGMDDIPKWLAEIMTEEGVTGSFFVIGEKARMMEKRGRQDVIAAMSGHDIGSHTNMGSIHPTVTEILENDNWEEGVQHMLENEGAGMDELERIFGQRPVNLARHGGSYGPQLVAALGDLNAGYVYSPISLPGHNAVWFCNTLNFHGEGDYGFFDDTYYRDDLFNPLLEALDSLIPSSIEEIDVVAFFGCHPSKVRSIQFWDFNYYQGANPGPDEWQTPELRPLESMETAKKNFRRLVRYLRDRDDIELTTYRELAHRFSHQRDSVSREELTRIAAKILHEKKVLIDDHYSAAEIFAALAESIVLFHHQGSLPEHLKIRRPYGPHAMPPMLTASDNLQANTCFQLAVEALTCVEETDHLPTFVTTEGIRIGTGSLLALFSDMFLQISDQEVPDQFALIPMDAYPVENEEQIIREVVSCKTWPVHREDLEMDHLAEMTRLQLWTLKPAWPIEH